MFSGYNGNKLEISKIFTLKIKEYILKQFMSQKDSKEIFKRTEWKWKYNKLKHGKQLNLWAGEIYNTKCLHLGKRKVLK